MIRLLTFFCLFCCLLNAQKIDTFYGSIDIEEPVLLELIESPAFQRLKDIHQYGVAYYTTHREEYTRYDHSLGVFAALRRQNVSLEEQIAGLLHDVSHTVFSHVGDWIFNKENDDKDYQNDIHINFLKQSGLDEILQKYDFSAANMLPTQASFPALECELPNLCADRIDYNIQGAFHQGFITYEEAIALFESLTFIDGVWISTNPELMAKVVRFSLFMTLDCWGGARNHLASRWLADAILRCLELGSISYEDIHLGTDAMIWNKLVQHTDPLICKKMHMLAQAETHYSLVSEADANLIIKSKFRGIDPWILHEGKRVRLTSLNPLLAEEFARTKKTAEKGWSVKITPGK